MYINIGVAIGLDSNMKVERGGGGESYGGGDILTHQEPEKMTIKKLNLRSIQLKKDN